ncbi:MAG: RNA polymerase sigma factor [Myxococcota bacterium]
MAEFVRTRHRAPFERLFRRYRGRMVSYAMKYVRRQDRAEELAQDVFVRVYTTRRYEPSASFRAWLYRVATNLCLNEVRRGEYRVAREDLDDHAELSLGPGAGPEADFEARELTRRLEETLHGLPEKQRAAFLMARFEGLSHEEIASALGSSVPAVKSLIHRALERLRQRMEAEEAAHAREAMS